MPAERLHQPLPRREHVPALRPALRLVLPRRAHAAVDVAAGACTVGRLGAGLLWGGARPAGAGSGVEGLGPAPGRGLLG